MKSHKRIAAWLSDHLPSLEQRDYFENRGYKIVQVRSPMPERWKNANQIYSKMMDRCGRKPDIIIMVLPSQGLGGSFMNLVQNIPIYQLEMKNEGGFWNWTGKTVRILGTHYIKTVEDVPYAY